MSSSAPLIHLSDVKKVFYTDEVETHALSGIHLAINAVGGQPSILLADEPTGNLDSTNGEAVIELLRELHRGGATICMVTHDARYAQHADRIVHLFDGLIVEEEAGANRREVEDAKRELRESGFGAI